MSKVHHSLFLTYDFLSTSKEKGKISLEILSCLEPLLKTLKCQLSKDNLTFEREKLFCLCHTAYNHTPFQTLIPESLTPEGINYISHHIASHTLLICYELSSQTREIFDNLHIQYIDIWLSPIRFYNDVMFEFYSNVPTIQKHLQRHALNERKLFQKARFLKQYIKYFLPDQLNIAKNSALIIGQVGQDKAILKNGKFLALIDFEQEIKLLSTCYTKLYFLKHPLMNEKDFQQILAFFKSLPNVEYLSNINSYELLAHKNIQCVAGISSSLLCEASYFKKKTLYFYKPVLGQEYARIHKKFFSTVFWKNILECKSIQTATYLVHDNFLRYKFNLTYGYKAFLNDHNERRAYQNFIELYQFISQLDQTKSYILYGYGSVGKLIAPHIPNLIGMIDQTSHSEKIHLNNINISEIKNYNDTYVIVSPFIYRDEIEKNLSQHTQNIIHLKGF